MTNTRVRLAHEYVELPDCCICIVYDANAFASDSCLTKYGEGRTTAEAEDDFYRKNRTDDFSSLPEVGQ